jgi:hypothetical protein
MVIFNSKHKMTDSNSGDMELEFIINPQNEKDVITNLLTLLQKKLRSLKIYAKCHEYLADKYYVPLDKIATYTMLILAGLSLFLSTTTQGISTTGENINIPWAILSAVTLVIKGISTYGNFAEKANAHRRDQKLCLDLIDDLEIIIIKNTHTTASLQLALSSYEERIKSFRKTEESVPIRIKQKILKYF